MNRKNRKQIILPLITAMVWGLAFVAQKSCADDLGPFSFNGIRYSFSALVVAVFLAVRGRIAGKRPFSEHRKQTLLYGTVLGLLLMIASNLQQIGVAKTTAGKAGFITALYIVLVPLFGLLIKKPVRKACFFGVAFALAGLYFLSFSQAEAIFFAGGDLYVLLCALVFTFHILFVDRFAKEADVVELACIQFAVASLSSAGIALFTERVYPAAVVSCLIPLLYAGFISGGVGYTLQVMAQKDGDPTVVSILLSLEAFFAVVSGAVILRERLTAREYVGCVLMLIAVILVQLPDPRERARN